MSTVNIWSVNLETKPGDVDFNTSAIMKYLHKAVNSPISSSVPDFILFPELSLSGHVNDPSRLKALTQDLAAALKKLRSATAELPKTVILIGYPHSENRGTEESKEEPKGPIFIRQSAILNGEFIHHHDKTRLSPGELKSFTPGRGTVQTQKTAVNSVNDTGRTVTWGTLLCYENHYPELATLLAKEKCDIIFAPFASPRETPCKKYRRLLRFLPARAYDNSCFLVSCNLIQEYPRTGRSPGVAVVIGPKGKILKKKLSRRESTCKVVLNLKEIDRIRSSSMAYFRGTHTIHSIEAFSK